MAEANAKANIKRCGPFHANTKAKADEVPKKRSHEKIWDEMYEQLICYVKLHGNANVKVKSGKLGNWVDNQRRRNKRNTLSQESVERLQAIGFQFRPSEGEHKGSQGERWESCYIEFANYLKQDGNTSNPKKRLDPQLKTWANNQRTKYRIGKLSHDRIDRLKELGFRFEVAQRKKSSYSSWKQVYREYLKRYGTTRNPKECLDPQLWVWANRQRILYRNGTLGKDRIIFLKEQGFRFEVTSSPVAEVVSFVSLQREQRYQDLLQHGQNTDEAQEQHTKELGDASSRLMGCGSKPPPSLPHPPPKLPPDPMAYSNHLRTNNSTVCGEDGVSSEGGGSRLSDPLAYSKLQQRAVVPPETVLSLPPDVVSSSFAT